MSVLKGLRLVVAGAGAVGSVLALQLARAGAEVVLADPGASGDNASGVAAGMLAPVFEALLDAPAAPLHPLLLQAQDAWAQVLGPQAGLLDQSGAMFRAPSPDAGDRMAERAEHLGAELQRITAEQAQAMLPGLIGDGVWMFTPQDWRLDPRAALSALYEAFAAEGGRRIDTGVLSFETGMARLGDGSAMPADGVILATGPKAEGWIDAPADRWLSPIKGQILRFAGAGPMVGPVVRAPGVYAVPGADGLVVGATMEEGISDLTIDPHAVARLQATASTLFPYLADLSPIASAGIRASTPDGAPVVGAGGRPGLWVARGARRNGWLLAPLIAEVMIERLAGGPSSIAAAAFDPARFQ